MTDEVLIAMIAAVPTTIVASATYVSSRRNSKTIKATRDIVQGNGRGDVVKVAEDTQDLAYRTATKLDEHIATTDQRHVEWQERLREIRQDIALIVTLIKRDDEPKGH